MATTLQTRIKSKVDTYLNWSTSNPVLLAGEIAVVTVPASTGAVQQEPAVLIKVGDGSSNFNALDFLSAKAANVYEWALSPTKPTYGAAEIDGLDAYISGKVQDTNTKYKIEVDAEDPYVYRLSYKELTGEWTVQDTITIPKDTLAEGSTNGTVSFNGQDVVVHGLGSAAYTESSEYDPAGSASAAQSAAQSYADGKITELNIGQYATTTSVTDAIGAAKTELIGTSTTGASSNTIKGAVDEAKSYADQKISAQISSTYKAAGSVLFASLPALSSTEEGKVYNVTDAFTTNDSFVEGTGKSYPAGTNVVCVNSDGLGTYKWDVLAGMVDLSAYDTAVVAQGKIDAAKQEAISHADDLNTAMDSRMSAVEADKHTHSNKALLDSYTQTEGNLAEAVSKKHEHTNKTVLDTINEAKVQSWDAKVDDSALSAIAKSGDAKDLTQTPGEYLIFDCGSSTVNI